MDKPSGKIRLEDLAKIAGVSVATVSRALNDSPAVNRVTKRRVWKIARDHNYVLNQDMPLSMSGSQATIAIVIPPPHGREVLHLQGAAFLVRRAAYADVGGMDEGYGMYSEEVDWAQRLNSAGWTILLAPAARVTHHAGQATRQRPGEMREALWTSRTRYFARWGTPRQRRLLPLLMRVGLARAERHADAAGRAANARVRAAFDDLADTRR